MSDVTMQVRNLGKRYQIGELVSVRHLYAGAKRAALAPWRMLSGRNGQAHHSAKQFIWAIRNISFELKRGEVLGIIGRNGAGKSTLLKVLSRITVPTEGYADIHGHVASLLEVGTGFHPELTGRENVYLNGSVLGMRKAQIDARFDQIVEFSGVEKFIDTPVKRYSSGMRVRLGFAVAAHLDPEILIVDEVLAVGDAEFQRKCLGKMSDVAGRGRTVLFVSHSMAAVQKLCTRCILLDDGMMTHNGTCEEVISKYLRNVGPASGACVDLSGLPRESNNAPIFHEATLSDNSGEPTTTFFPGQPLTVALTLSVPTAPSDPQIGIGVNDEIGQRLFTVGTRFSPQKLTMRNGRQTVRCLIPDLRLSSGTYTLTLGFRSHDGQYDQLERSAEFTVEGTDYFGSGRMPDPPAGRFLVRSQWSVDA